MIATAHAPELPLIPQPKSVIVPLDGSPYAERSLRVAKELGRLLRVEVGAVSINTEHQRPHPAYLEDVAGRFGLNWWQGGTFADVATGICDAAEEHESLICMATHGHGRSTAVLGSTADELVQRTDGGVVLVGRSFDQRMEHDFERVIVALDGTSTGDALCEKAASWAKMFGLGIQLVTVSEDTPAPLREGEDPFERFGLDGDAQAYVVMMMERLHAQGVETTGLAFSDPISPASGLSQLVRDQPGGILVTATQQSHGWHRLFHGSTAGNILDQSSVPILEFASHRMFPTHIATLQRAINSGD